jgi:hypothetical protein
MIKPPVAALGAALHNGWAIAVTVTNGGDGPVVIDRRRLELADPKLPSQPYHHESLELELPEAESLVLRVRRAVSGRARLALHGLREELADACQIKALALRESRPLPATLSEILATQALYIADAEIYRAAMFDAAARLGMEVLSYPKAGEFELAAETLGTDADEVTQLVRGWRKALGPPWQKDHHAAAAAAMGALSRVC